MANRVRAQCDQMLEIKVAQILSNVAQNDLGSFNCKKVTCQNSPQSHLIFGYFTNKNFCQELSKIAQSGHTSNWVV